MRNTDRMKKTEADEREPAFSRECERESKRNDCGLKKIWSIRSEGLVGS